MLTTTLTVSIGITGAALVWSLALLWRSRDWRLALLSALLLLIAVRESLALWRAAGSSGGTDLLGELPTLAISLLALAFVAGVDRFLATNRGRASERDPAIDAFEHLADDLPDVLWRIEPDETGRPVTRYVSSGWTRLSGREPEELYRNPDLWPSLIVPEDRDLAQQTLREALAGGGAQTVTYRMRAKRGDMLWIEDHLAPIVGADGEVVAIDGIARDITQRRQAETALARKHLEYNRLLDQLKGMAYRRRDDDSWTMELVSGGCLELTGHSAKALLNNRETAYAELIRGEDLPEARTALRDSLAAGGLFDHEYRIVTATGDEKWVWDRGRGVYDSDGRARSIEGFVTDVTDRKRAQIALRESEIRYRGLFEDSKDAVFISRMDGNWVDANPAAVELFGFSSLEEALASDIRGLHRDPSQRQHAFELLASEGAIVDYELALQTVDGRKLTVLETATPIRDENGVLIGARGILRDVTAARELERELQESRRMEALGRLAGGLAHDFNNLLTVILGYSHLLSMEAGLPETSREPLEQITEATNRATALVEQLLAFARQQVLEPRAFNLHRAVEEIESLLRAGLGDDVQLLMTFNANPSRVKADPGQIEQALMNIAANAREAMPGGGRFEIETSNVLFNDPKPGPGAPRPGRYVELAISDTGIGMDEETRARAFEPFFSTKAKGGQASGLGLSTVYGIVQQSGGTVGIDSSPGAGTVLRIFLPQVDEPLPVTDAARRLGGEAVELGTILLTEDDPEIARLVERILESNGYRALVATRPGEAVAILERLDQPIDLLITDLVLPEMSGLDLLAAAEDLRPGLRMLAISGYSEETVQRQNSQTLDVPLLRKPFTPADLIGRVRELLGPATAFAAKDEG